MSEVTRLYPIINGNRSHRNQGWSIAYIVVSQVDIEFLSLKITFVLANSVDHDKKPLPVTFHLGLHCLPKYPFTSV